MVASDSFAEFLREQLAPLGRITMRRMFGKTGVFCDDVMLGMVTENTLYFRVDDHNRATFEEANSFPPLNHRKKGFTSSPSTLSISGGCVTVIGRGDGWTIGIVEVAAALEEKPDKQDEATKTLHA